MPSSIAEGRGQLLAPVNFWRGFWMAAPITFRVANAHRHTTESWTLWVMSLGTHFAGMAAIGTGAMLCDVPDAFTEIHDASFLVLSARLEPGYPMNIVPGMSPSEASFR